MKILKCSNCGANLEIKDDNREFAFCEYCGTKIQLNEKIILDVTGDVSVKGLSTVDSLCKRGFSEIAAKDYFAAAKAFDDAANIDCDNINVLIGKMLTKVVNKGKNNQYATFDPYYYEIIKKYSDTISKEEKHWINEETCELFLKLYCLMWDKGRADYVISNFPSSVSMELISFEHFCERASEQPKISEYSKISINYAENIRVLFNKDNPINVIEIMVENGCPSEKVLDYLYAVAYAGYNNVASLTWYNQIDCSILQSHVLKYLASKFDLSQKRVPILKLDRKSDYTTHITEMRRFKDEYSYNSCLLGEPDEVSKVEEYLRNLKKENEKGCYIATAVYGSYDCPQVWTLRRYRDYSLASTWYGRLFIRTYYAISPTLVKLFGDKKLFKILWKGKLDKMVEKLNLNGYSDTPYDDKM